MRNKLNQDSLWRCIWPIFSLILRITCFKTSFFALSLRRRTFFSFFVNRLRTFSSFFELLRRFPRQSIGSSASISHESQAKIPGLTILSNVPQLFSLTIPFFFSVYGAFDFYLRTFFSFFDFYFRTFCHFRSINSRAKIPGLTILPDITLVRPFFCVYEVIPHNFSFFSLILVWVY